ncbi:MAG TPA: YceI family protein [Vicinamibacterales bacterium]|nr:YceI family protein [Vicinamibacterales bacterium]
MTTSASSTRTYKIDKAHSEAVFQVRHLLTKVQGRFTDFEGSIQFNEAAPEQSTVDFTIKATSIDTAEPDRDKHLRSADFFDVEKFPTITFRSKRIVKKGPDTYDVVGDFAVHGVTKEITLPVTHLGKAKDPWGGDRLGFEAEFMMNRKDYGLSWNAALETGGFLVGDEVKAVLQIQAVGQ